MKLIPEEWIGNSPPPMPESKHIQRQVINKIMQKSITAIYRRIDVYVLMTVYNQSAKQIAKELNISETRIKQLKAAADRYVRSVKWSVQDES